jgi:MBG domain-containing protein/trehalose utilization protein
MTGPRNSPVHPHRRRGRLLLPFLAAIALTPLGCTSDKLTEPQPSQTPALVAAPTGPHPRARLYSATISSAQGLKAKSSANFSMAHASSNSGPSVLILADLDGATTDALRDTLDAAGFQVSVRQAPEYTWTGSDPVLDGFDVVVHLNGSTYDVPLTPGGQRALNSFVQGGGGYVGAQWNPVEWTPEMADLLLTNYGGTAETQNCAACQVTYEVISGQEGHPVLAGLPSSFAFTADGHDAGPLVPDLSSEILMQTSGGGAAVVVRQFGSGKVVNFSFAPNYPFDENGEPRDPTTLQDEHVKGLYVNAVRWLAGSAVGEPQDQTITFDPLTNKVFGDAAFLLNVTASSGLPVSLTPAGECTVTGNTVTITGAGSCSITASQAGNADFNTAANVVRSFTIAKASATLALGNLSHTYNGSALAASATTSPAGLTGVSITYNGSAIPPVNAGSYSVIASLTNDNYQAAPVTGTLVVAKASATMSVGTEFLYDGTPKQAVVSTTPGALEGVTVSYSQNGLSVTSPLNAGTYQVLAHLENQNYQASDAQGTLVIRQATPVIQWSPAPLIVGTQLGDAQLNATATGVGGAAVAGNFVYNPAAGARFNPGIRTLSVQFSTTDGNYTSATKTVELSVVHKFSGFYQPVKNLPVMNVVRAGRTVPLKFSLEMGAGLRILQVGTPSSTAVSCGAAPQSTMEDQAVTSLPGLRMDGLTYTYHWNTNASWAGSCRKLVLTLDDGSKHEALFRFVQNSSSNPVKSGKKEEKNSKKELKASKR